MTVLDMILSSDYREFDELPTTAKVLLASRLMSSTGTDLTAFRDRIFHRDPVSVPADTVSFPTVRARHGLLGDSPQSALQASPQNYEG